MSNFDEYEKLVSVLNWNWEDDFVDVWDLELVLV